MMRAGRALGFAAAAAVAAVVVVGAGARDEKLALVTVAADQGKPASGLTPADFKITEEGGTVEVVEAVPAKDPLSIALLVDTALPDSGSAVTPELRRALKSFVETINAGEPSAQIALYQVANAAVPVKDFTSSRAELDAAIDVIASGSAAGSKMLEGVVLASKLVSVRQAPRRAIVCVSIGTTDGTSLNPRDVFDALSKSGATLWVVSVQSARDKSMTNRDELWTRGTEQMGGLRLNVVQATRLDVPLKSVANSLLSQYFLKMARSRNGALKGFKGKTSGGSSVLLTRWTR
jgi:hypothetical protein